MYAVIDVETTGLRASWHDRIIEIAVVHPDADGRVQNEWCSLVNPDRDLGPQHIHGISAAEAERAPAFARLAGTVADLLRGRTLVAHNGLLDLAEALGLGQADVRCLHKRFLTGLAAVALADGVLTPAERHDLDSVAALIGLPPTAVDKALTTAASPGRQFWQLRPGDRWCSPQRWNRPASSGRPRLRRPG